MAESDTKEDKKETNEAATEEVKADKTEDKKVEKEAKAEKTTIPAKFKDLVGTIEKLSVLELSELVKVLEDHFGVSAAAPVAVAAVGAAGGGEAEEAAETKSAYDLVLQTAGDKKIDVIKAVREISGLGLAESKALVDGAPKTVKTAMAKDEAEEGKKKLEEAGATVELQ